MSDVIRDNRRRDCYRVFNLGNKRRLGWSFRIFCWRRMQLFLSGSRYLDRCEVFLWKPGFDRVTAAIEDPLTAMLSAYLGDSSASPSEGGTRHQQVMGSPGYMNPRGTAILENLGL